MKMMLINNKDETSKIAMGTDLTPGAHDYATI